MTTSTTTSNATEDIVDTTTTMPADVSIVRGGDPVVFEAFATSELRPGMMVEQGYGGVTGAIYVKRQASDGVDVDRRIVIEDDSDDVTEVYRPNYNRKRRQRTLPTVKVVNPVDNEVILVRTADTSVTVGGPVYAVQTGGVTGTAPKSGAVPIGTIHDDGLTIVDDDNRFVAVVFSVKGS